MLSKLTALFRARNAPQMPGPRAEAPALDPIDEMTPDYALAAYVGGGGAEQYRAIGRMMVEWFQMFGI
jgi:hypothetical protein